MKVDQLILLFTVLTFVGFIAFVVLYLTNERKVRKVRETQQAELKELLKYEVNALMTNLQTKLDEDLSLSKEMFDALAKEILTTLIQASAENNSYFVKINAEYTAIKKDIEVGFDENRTAFKAYAEKVRENLIKYSSDNAEFKKRNDELKEHIQRELHNILREIKAPLDLD